MSPSLSHLFAVLALAAAVAPPAFAEGDPVAGKQLYATRCSACHSIDFNGTGPMHRNLFGRKAGSVPGFPYSQALKDAKVVWGEDTLARWLTDPEKFIPGQRMFISVPDAQERADILAYLRLATAPSTPNPGERK
jgi:cytochrome c